jgi:multimeric flavodoxin WrbA
MDELARCGEIDFTEIFPLQALPEFCVGCQLCLGNPHEKCPHSQFVSPILAAMLEADALIVTSPHYGAATMPASLKNLFDHLDFLTMTIAPRAELFDKKAFVITTGSGSKSVVRTIVKCLKNWGINRVGARGFRFFTDKWDKLAEGKKQKFEIALRRDARRFYRRKRSKPYLGTVLMYHVSKFVLQRFVGEGAYPYEYWLEHGWFKNQPF